MMKNLILILMIALPGYAQTNLQLGTALSDMHSQFIAERNRTDWFMTHYGSAVIQPATNGARAEVVWKTFNEQYSEYLSDPPIKVVSGHDYAVADVLNECSTPKLIELICDSINERDWGQTMECVRALSGRDDRSRSLTWAQYIAQSVISEPTTPMIDTRCIADDPVVDIRTDGFHVYIGRY